MHAVNDFLPFEAQLGLLVDLHSNRLIDVSNTMASLS